MVDNGGSIDRARDRGPPREAGAPGVDRCLPPPIPGTPRERFGDSCGDCLVLASGGCRGCALNAIGNGSGTGGAPEKVFGRIDGERDQDRPSHHHPAPRPRFDPRPATSSRRRQVVVVPWHGRRSLTERIVAIVDGRSRSDRILRASAIMTCVYIGFHVVGTIIRNG